MKKTASKQVTLDKKKTVTYNEIAIAEIKQEINIVEEVTFAFITKISKWIEKVTGIVL